MSMKRNKVSSSISPSMSTHLHQFETPTPSSASSKLSRPDQSDTDILSIFIESLTAWLNGYFFSKLSLENCQLPTLPRLENTELYDSCKSLRLTISKVRETVQKKLSSDKSKPTSNSTNKLLTSSGTFDNKPLTSLIDSTLAKLKQKVVNANYSKQSLLDKCEELCSCALSSMDEIMTSKARIKDLESQLDIMKTKRGDRIPEEKNKQESNLSLIQLAYPLMNVAFSLQEKKQFYSLLYRHYDRLLKREEDEVRRLLDTAKIGAHKRLSFKTYALSVYAAICIKNLRKSEEKIAIKGLKLKLLDTSISNQYKNVNLKNLSGAISNINKITGGPVSNQAILNSLITFSISGFQKFMNDIKAVLAILLKNHADQKEEVLVLMNKLKEVDDERNEMEGALTRTVEYTKNLEEEIIEMTGDPDYLRQIGEDAEMSLELEAHKKALKGLTSQYNQLEIKFDEANRAYGELKKECELKTKRIAELEGMKKK